MIGDEQKRQDGDGDPAIPPAAPAVPADLRPQNPPATLTPELASEIHTAIVDARVAAEGLFSRTSKKSNHPLPIDLCDAVSFPFDDVPVSLFVECHAEGPNQLGSHGWSAEGSFAAAGD